MVPPEMPKKLLVIGSGAIGIEFASFYNDMGAEVTVVEVMDRIVPVEDADVSTFLEKALKKQGMTILTGQGRGQSLKASATSVTADIKDKDGKVAKSEFSHASSPSASSAIPRISGWKSWASKIDQGPYRYRRMCRTNVPGSGRSAMSPRRPGWRTRPAMKA
jgi:dihydrolipoamide dehydrogenase